MKKRILIIVSGFIGFVFLIFIVGFLILQYKKTFGTRMENVNREIFEETKSYIHGVIQDLGKYYDEYQKAGIEKERDAIANTIKIRFAEFDATRIKSKELREFLVEVRGY
jgi:hypothetical protein